MTLMRRFFDRAAASSFARSGLVVFASVLVGNALNYTYLLMLGRLLPISDYGAVMSLIAAVLLVLSIGTVFQTVIAKLAADLQSAGDVHQTAALSRVVSLISVWAAIGVFSFVFALEHVIASYLHFAHTELITLAGGVAAFGIMLMFQRGCFQGLGDFRVFGVSALLEGSRALYVVPFTVALGAAGSIIAIIAAGGAAALYGAFVLRKHYAATSSFAKINIRRMLTSAWATAVSSLAITILFFSDVLLARHFLAPAEAGLYGALSLASRVILTLVSFIPTILLPRIATRHARGSSDLVVLAGAVAATVALAGVLTLACAIAPTTVLRILAGPKFISGAVLLPAYALASGNLALANVLVTYAIARHRLRFVPYVWVIAVTEISVVYLRHGSAREIVTIVLAGHSAVCCTMIGATVFDLIGKRPLRYRETTT